MLIAPTTTDLATFTGRPATTFSGFADEALAQATLMFTVVTKLGDYPDDPQLAQLARNAIMELADRLLLEQPYAEVSTRPFSSETIGSYTYTRATATAAKVTNGQKTGLFWWDIAVDELTVAGASVLEHGSIKSDIAGLELDELNLVRIVTPAEGEDQPPYVRIS